MGSTRHEDGDDCAATLAARLLAILLTVSLLVPAHLTHTHSCDTDDTTATCNICIRLDGNPPLAVAAPVAPVPVGAGIFTCTFATDSAPVTVAAPRGRAPPVPVS